MTATIDFDRLLRSILEAGGPHAVPSSLVEAALTEARALPQRRPRVPALDRRAWPASRYGPLDRATARPAVVGLVIVLTIALIAAAIGIGGRLLRADVPEPPLNLSVVANGLIAISANPDGVGGGEVGDIYLVSETAAARRIIGSDDDGVAQACPRFSPDGHRLAYGEARASEPVTTYGDVWPVSDRAVVVIGLNDRGDPSPPIVRVPAPTEPGRILCPEWSPDSRLIAFRIGPGLWVADATTGETDVFPVVEAPWGQEGFEWSRDGSLIAVAEPGQIRVVPLDRSRESILIAVAGATPRPVGWKAGDDLIVYIATDIGGFRSEVHTVSTDGSTDTHLTLDPIDSQIELSVGDAVVSPDGARVAFGFQSWQCSDGCPADPQRLVIVDVDGSNVIEVPIGPETPLSGLQWSPDGKRLLGAGGDGVVSLAVLPGTPPVVHSRAGELNLEWSGSEVTWQPVPR